MYQLDSERHSLGFRRDWLHNFFNPRINEAIETFHEHIRCVQNSSVDDYDFIVERIARFYARKYSRMEQEIPSSLGVMEDNHDKKIVEVGWLVDDLKGLLMQIGVALSADESRFDEHIASVMREIEDGVQEARSAGIRETDEFLRKCEDRNRRFGADSEHHCLRLVEQHQLVMERIRREATDSAGVPKMRVRDDETPERYRNESFEMRVVVKGMRREHGDFVRIMKERISLMHKDAEKGRWEAAEAVEMNRKETEALFQLLMEEEKRMCEERLRKRMEMQKLVEAKDSALAKLIKGLHGELERRRNEEGAGGDAKQSELDRLREVLECERGALSVAIAENVAATEDIIETAAMCVVTENETHERRVLEAERERKGVIGGYMRIERDREAELSVERGKIAQELEKERLRLLEEGGLMIDGSGCRLRENESEYDRLTLVKEERIMENKEKLDTCDAECLYEIDSLREYMEQEVLCTRDLLLNEEKQRENELACTVVDRRRSQERILEEARDRLESERPILLDAIEMDGYSLEERVCLEKAYIAEFANLQRLVSLDVPFIAERNVFSNMESALSDLKRQLADRKCMTNGLRTVLISDWRAQETAEMKRYNSATGPRCSNRAREQAKKSLLGNIKTVRAMRDEEVTVLEDALHALCSRISWKSCDSDVLSDEDRCVLEQEWRLAEATAAERFADAERQFNDKRRCCSDAIRDETRRVTEIADRINMSLQMQTNLFNRELENLTESRKQSGSGSAHFEHSVKIGNRHEMHKRNVATLRCKCQSHLQSIAETRDLLSQQTQAVDERMLARIHALTERLEAELSGLVSERDTRLAIASEKSHNMATTLRCTQESQANAHHADRAERLELILQTKQTQLLTAIKDLTQYRALYIDQEQKINSKFKSGRDVGVLPRTSTKTVSVS